MRMSPEGRKRLTAREGIRLNAYKDSVGVWSIGVGHTSAAGSPNVTPNLTLTRAEVDSIFARDLVKYETAVNNAVRVQLAQHEFDALVSLCYNIGPGAFAKSTLVRLLNAGDRAGAAAAFLMWAKPAEIIGRRKSERLQFLGAQSTGGIVAGGGAVVAGGGAALQAGVPPIVVFLIIVAIAGGGAFFILRKRKIDVGQLIKKILKRK